MVIILMNLVQGGMLNEINWGYILEMWRPNTWENISVDESYLDNMDSYWEGKKTNCIKAVEK